MTIGEIQDERPAYAASIQQLADRMQEAGNQPIGCFVVVFWKNGSVTNFQRFSQGFNFLMAGGIFTKLAHKMLGMTEEKEAL